MAKRPVSLTILGWYLIVAALAGAASFWLLRDNPRIAAAIAATPVSPAIQLTVAAIGVLVSAVSGYGVLRGYEWSRWLYIGWMVLVTLYGILTAPALLLIGLNVVIVAIFAFFLFRRPAEDWFSAGETG
jgi:hypothetical protein